MTIRIGYASDLHLEFEANRDWFGAEAFQRLKAARAATPGHPDIGPLLSDLAGAVDIMVLAGDIWQGTRGIAYSTAVASFLGVPVITVAGNHEFYGHQMESLRSELAATAVTSGVHFLDNTRADFQIGGQRLAVLGSTLWTSMEGSRPNDVAANMRQARRMNDCDNIYVQSKEMTPQDIAALHQAARDWLEANIPRAQAESDAVLVVTHHAPLLAAVVTPERVAVDFSYASPLDSMIAVLRPDAWIFGHTHVEAFRREVAGVPVVSAARGYVTSARGWNFRPQILELALTSTPPSR